MTIGIHTNRDYNTNTATSVKNRKLLYSMQWHFLAQTDENVFLTMSQCHLKHNLEKNSVKVNHHEISSSKAI